jgi:hypothetical protein
MAIAPEPYLSALTAVLDRAILFCRNYNWSPDFPHEHTADLMDAIHNIPAAIQDWQPWHADFLRDYLQTYESKWLPNGGLSLCQLFDETVAGRESPPHAS